MHRVHDRTNANERTNSRSHARTHVRTYARTHVRTYARTHARTRARAHVRTYARMHVCTYARTHVRTYARPHVRTYAGMRLHTLQSHTVHDYVVRTPVIYQNAHGTWISVGRLACCCGCYCFCFYFTHALPLTPFNVGKSYINIHAECEVLGWDEEVIARMNRLLTARYIYNLTYRPVYLQLDLPLGISTT